ncbi:Universal stress protein [Pyrococcus sp. NA2]|uniref:universal stress protein n=1 Tax=Pyrococcus sp. (strain NA2) TaxID=342949 RepID=UPI000209ACE1|nr:universal stress protein [Pyrococcus sp. NA2]AEC52783.1 Universal stress protein [Pyrococcus sp. NA2]
MKECIPRLFELGAKKLYLVHIVDITVANIEAIDLVSIDEEEMKRIARELDELGINVEPIVKPGIPSLEIAEIAQEKEVDLIIIPSKGENILRQMFLGSTAANLVRATKRPVLVVKYEWDEKEKRIRPLTNCGEIFRKPLVALDFSECSKKVVNIVEKFEELIEDLILIHVVDYGKIEELEENIKKAKENLEKFAINFKVSTRIEVSTGIASRSILGTSIAKERSLIVIGKKGRSVIKDLLLGSTAERVVRESKLPVLLVPCD